MVLGQRGTVWVVLAIEMCLSISGRKKDCLNMRKGSVKSLRFQFAIVLMSERADFV